MRPPKSFWIAFGVLALSLLPLLGSNIIWAGLAPLLLIGAPAIERIWWRRGRSANYALLGALAIVWGYFWSVDLSEAKVRFLLVILPFPGLFIAGLKGAKSTFRDLLAGGLLALGPIWSVLAIRADNGCTGVSFAYSATLFASAPILFLLGPSIFADLVDR